MGRTPSAPDKIAAPLGLKTADIVRALLFPVILAALYYVAERFGLRDWATDSLELQKRMEAWGRRAPFMFVLAYTVLPLMFIPRSLLALIGGFAFGWPSVLYTWAGAYLGESLAFWLARILGRPLFKSLVERTRAARLVDFIQAEGFWAVFVLRLFPFTPTDAVNFGSAFAGIRYLPFVAGTQLGILPGCVLFSYYGQLFGAEPVDMLLAIPLLLVQMILCVGVARWRWRRIAPIERGAKSAKESEQESGGPTPPNP